VIDEISKAISQTKGCLLLDVDAGSSTNRTVYTFVGSPEDVVVGALNAAKIAFQFIDMAKHKGEHPRMGALDVCPFIPVRNVTMEECVYSANLFGKCLADELHLKKAEWTPDFGPATFVPRWGATVTGARKFLIAYNINLLCTKELAHRIALNIREQGRSKNQPGRLKQVQGMGWYLDEENIAQVSTNLLDFETTPLHVVFEEVCKDAKDLNLPVVGSQLVGLIPKKAMLDAAEFYIKKENIFILEEEHKIRLGAALGCMVGLMTYGKRQFEELDPVMRQLIPPFHQAMNQLIAIVDRDSLAFSSYMDAMKLPKQTPEEKERRTTAMQLGLKNAVDVPFSLAEKINSLWPFLKEMAQHGNIACKSDIQVAVKALEAGVFGAYFNVITNLKDITDEDFTQQ
ncbi:Formimidoyltransferase-cyclodeaminase, partial [Ophiophagus hannah]